MRRGYSNSRRSGATLLGVLSLSGWLLALAVGAVFAWYAIWGPGSSRTTAAPSPAPSPTMAAATPIPTPLPTDTEAPTPTPSPTVAPTSTPRPVSTAEPVLTPTPSATLVAGADGANVRAGPGTYYETLGFLESGDTAAITGRYENWFQIDFDGKTGWVASWIVTATDADNVPQVEPPSETEGTPTVSPTAVEVTPTEPITTTTPGSPSVVAGADGANVRSGPGTEFEALGRLKPGETAVITGRYEDWLQIDFNGAPAWVASWVVTATGVENVPVVEPPVATATPEPTTEPTVTPS